MYRVIDANVNRAKEGVRVCEDISRFLFSNKKPTKKFRHIRHSLSRIIDTEDLTKLILSRDSKQDVGRTLSSGEFDRKTVFDIFFANAQRVKESIRVLEECMKLINKKKAVTLKRLRYTMYELEKHVTGQLNKL
jgi:thiamine-phosphate pyrophosphorylase